MKSTIVRQNQAQDPAVLWQKHTPLIIIYFTAGDTIVGVKEDAYSVLIAHCKHAKPKEKKKQKQSNINVYTKKS